MIVELYIDTGYSYLLQYRVREEQLTDFLKSLKREQKKYLYMFNVNGSLEKVQTEREKRS